MNSSRRLFSVLLYLLTINRLGRAAKTVPETVAIKPLVGREKGNTSDFSRTTKGGASNDFDLNNIIEDNEGSRSDNDPIDTISTVGIQLEDGVFVNPCTGSISFDSMNDFVLPCLDVTNTPTTSNQPLDVTNTPTTSNQPTASPVAPSYSPTISSAPSKSSAPSQSFSPSITISPSSSTNPSSAPSKEFVDTISCTGVDTCDPNSNRTITVSFKYSVETTNNVTEPEALIPQLEETLLQKLADALLRHCLDSSQLRNLMPRRSLRNVNTLDRRIIHNKASGNERRRLETVGICSFPYDEYIMNEECLPELEDDNNCFIVDGGLTLSIEDGDSTEKMIEEVKNITKKIMLDDELITDDNPGVKKVKFLDGDNNTDNGDNTVIGEPASGEPPVSVMVGASLATLAALLGLYIMKRKATSIENEDNLPVVLSPASLSSFVAPASDNLAKHASCMDVHECTSAICHKCYTGQQTQFVPSRNVSHFESIRDQQDNDIAATLEQINSPDKSEESYIDTMEHIINSDDDSEAPFVGTLDQVFSSDESESSFV